MRVGEPFSAGRTLRVLVVEDDFFTRDILDEVLSEIDADVSCVSGLADVASDALPDLVISDLVGPSAHRAECGSEYLLALRARFPAAKILVLTAQSWVFGGATALPVDDLVAKPFDLEQLLLRIHALVEPMETLGGAG